MPSRRAALRLLAGAALVPSFARSPAMAESFPVIDDLSRPHPEAVTGTNWELVSDRVMGGVSGGTIVREEVAGRMALRMRGEVSLENNGGFLQIALDLAPGGDSIDASGWRGMELEVLGNGEEYNLHLRTDDVARPWQSYRQSFVAGPEWQTVRLDFAGFAPHRLEAPLDLTHLRRIGLVAIGRAFTADLALAGIRFYG
ncbi:CIA30 family protein [Nisaea sp.]|uniref:CIA30 family protein n=1 Tax=Nisaea sp. TaxID=2024842 RepID=UPI003B516AF8